MRLATFVSTAGPRAAVLGTDDTLVPVADLAPGAPEDVLGVLDAGPALWNALRGAARAARGGAPLSSAQLLAPIPRPRRNVLCVGWNYSEHFAEGQGSRGPRDDIQELPEWPALFTKSPSTVVGPGAAIWHPAPHSDQLDWEVELAVVIGRPGRDIPEERAFEHVFGYTVANDVSVRDIQRRHGGQWFKGKSFDTHCPMGPWIVTADEVPNPHALRVTCRVNGVAKQDSSTRFMVFRIPRLLRDCSVGMELLPGDVILTGTPEGTGFARKPPEFLRVGDVLETEVEQIGVLRNPVVAYDAGAPTGPAAAAASLP